MPLPEAKVTRTPVHTRSVRIDAFRRDDGQWDLEAELVDVKPHDTPLRAGIRPAGEPIHAMRLRVTIDRRFEITDACAVSDSVPYRGFCEAVTPDYGKIVGLNLLRGFRQALRERLGGVHGCTHMTELAQLLPTAAVQSFAGDPAAREHLPRSGEADEEKPFQLDRCHAMRTDGPAVQQYYPRWFRSAA